MAQSDDEKLQKDLLGQLDTNNVTIADDAAKQMKENILNDRGSANYLGIGIHDVTVTSVELTQAKTGTLGMRFNVENADGRSDVTMWLSQGALPYTIENVSRLMVFNAADDKKEGVRDFMSNVDNAKQLYSVVTEALATRAKNKMPFSAFLSIREDRNGNTYTDKNGDTKPSLERNLLAYKPKETPTQSVVSTVGGEPASDFDISQVPF